MNKRTFEEAFGGIDPPSGDHITKKGKYSISEKVAASGLTALAWQIKPASIPDKSGELVNLSDQQPITHRNLSLNTALISSLEGRQLRSDLALRPHDRDRDRDQGR